MLWFWDIYIYVLPQKLYIYVLPHAFVKKLYKAVIVVKWVDITILVSLNPRDISEPKETIGRYLQPICVVSQIIRILSHSGFYICDSKFLISTNKSCVRRSRLYPIVARSASIYLVRFKEKLHQTYQLFPILWTNRTILTLTKADYLIWVSVHMY